MCKFVRKNVSENIGNIGNDNRAANPNGSLIPSEKMFISIEKMYRKI